MEEFENESFHFDYRSDHFMEKNATPNVTDSNFTYETRGLKRHLPFHIQVVISSLYLFGILGNISALIIIVRKEKKRFQKQTLMIKCLAMNDLTALLGSGILMYVHLYVPSANIRCMCVFRVLFRAFGLGSGCVALVMALDRWLALSHPFIYQKHVTNHVIRRAIVGLWSINAMLVCAPFFGLGLWFDEERTKPCVRYRYGTTTRDRIYAYLMFVFGINLCLGIVCCNMSVIRALCHMGKSLVSRSFSRSSNRSASSANEGGHLSTPDEVAFARLMGILSIFFVLCWAPQLLTIIAAQHSLLPPTSPTYRAADILIAMNFTLDPYIYVLFRHQQICRSRQLHKIESALNSIRKRQDSSYVEKSEQANALYCSEDESRLSASSMMKTRSQGLCSSSGISVSSEQSFKQPRESICTIGSANRGVSFKKEQWT